MRVLAFCKRLVDLWRKGEKNDRLLIGQKCLGRESENERRKLDGHTK